jgi:hypothetical protein
MAEGHGTYRGADRTRSGRSAAKAPMTLEEALRIEQQLDRGRLDLTLPGTDEVIGEAHRVRLKAAMWGTDRSDDRRRQAKGTVVVVCAFIAVTIAGLIACLVVAV